ncbi:hypothetical protein [Bacillus cereus]|uniref:hypothetical protein n=1 Tax=Bacillus cereus TaxID=1396 RepID=UPI001155591D|nr:hypothetical protein [Bacillus cereus]
MEGYREIRKRQHRNGGIYMNGTKNIEELQEETKRQREKMWLEYKVTTGAVTALGVGLVCISLYIFLQAY